MTGTDAENAVTKNTTPGLLVERLEVDLRRRAALCGNQAISITAILLKYTYCGDTDCNGVANFDGVRSKQCALQRRSERLVER